jgi:hypothetical protein
MKIIPYIPVITCCIVAAAPAALADSPLTSTNFAVAYQDVNVVRYASKHGLDEKVFKALSDPDVPQDVRAAIVNQIGWSNNPQQNAQLYLDYVASSHRMQPSNLTLAMLTSQESMALGYLLAMDNRFSVTTPMGGSGEVQRADALSFMNAAAAKAPKDFSVALLGSLVQAHKEFAVGPDNWCSVYETVESVVDDFPGEKNMRPQAVEIIMDYIGNYQKYCTSPPQL